MNWSQKLLAAMALAVLAAGSAAAADRAAIRFADYGGIENWRAAEDGSLLVEARNGKWYRATFYGACPELRFETAIGFVTDSLGQLDRFSSVVVDGRRCWFRSFEEIEDPDANDDE